MFLQGITLRKNENNNNKPWLLPSQPELWATEETDLRPCMMPLEDEDVEELDVETMLVEVKSENDSLSAKQRCHLIFSYYSNTHVHMTDHLYLTT